MRLFTRRRMWSNVLAAGLWTKAKRRVWFASFRVGSLNASHSWSPTDSQLNGGELARNERAKSVTQKLKWEKCGRRAAKRSHSNVSGSTRPRIWLCVPMDVVVGGSRQFSECVSLTQELDQRFIASAYVYHTCMEVRMQHMVSGLFVSRKWQHCCSRCTGEHSTNF